MKKRILAVMMTAAMVLSRQGELWIGLSKNI